MTSRADSAEPLHVKNQDLKTYYAARAPYYDDVYARPERAADIAFLTEHLPQRVAGLSVLEVACGTGFWTPHLARTAAGVTATDATAEPLALAQQRPGTERVRFEQADAYQLPEHLGRFEAAFAGLWLSHVPISRRPAFLASLHARLKPGARVLLLDNNEVQRRDFPNFDTDAEGNTYQHRPLRDGTVHRVLKNFPSAAELAALVAPVASRHQHHALANFWLFEYELHRP